ncbi:MAG: 2-amino-4-hydroxy-6-hydroxymethyldihydropteridine diphosphokinase [Gammaproteobacteria bacterium]|nr:2-amino-4-hydroxy-6-hydroxymethyldihydropteridine diphosphokinase [Gammaproteobacteria bacterium]NDE34374.1 2-amino-4-hydroxy-6-hydroxymethyldihydropteridine diphosphokinase [Gammaproteobacteria bacterium]NDE56317.1 2-amino-4-hydroxy-6-hydroxymethyldihydropteridine diphosphokinase [Gammaproteobacteria bacterium]NDG87486.1 2-amino-4-hydroxy-6-hydroxymethyldihydropteridine diphosphokinase [Gammaproteobacteria bacterium]
MTMRAYIGLGGNLEKPQQHLLEARHEIASLHGVEALAFSPLYRSAPMGPRDQPDYINAVMAIETQLPPLELLDSLQAIEAAHGRVRQGERWGPRTLDLDLLVYGDREIQSERLTVPHPGISLRRFVLLPLHDIEPHLEIPGLGSLESLLAACPSDGWALILEAEGG